MLFHLKLKTKIYGFKKKEFAKPCFVSKKFVSENDIEDNKITLPLWFWNKIEEDIINDSVIYSKEKLNIIFSNRDFKVLNETKILD